MTRRRRDRRRPLLLYTALTIIAGALAAAWTAVSFPIDEAISLTVAGGREGILLGLVFWVVVGLLGGTRVERLHGHGVLTFHIPFIIAAMALGGPAAGALVALVSTIERREIREVPWYGLLANHASLALGAIGGGIVLLGIRGWLAGIGYIDPHAVELVAIVSGGFVLTVVSVALAGGTVMLRDGLTAPELARVYDTSFRATAASEVVLGWILVVTFASVGWWAALICSSLVLAIWQAHDDHERSRHDPMTGLLSRNSFDEHLTRAIAAVDRREEQSALLSIDLDGFKAINDTYGHAVGDDVIRVVGERLRSSIRLTDAGVRRGGDEFGILLRDMPDRATAERLALRIHARLCEPIELDDRTVEVGASIGMYVLGSMEKLPTTGRMHDLTDRLMYTAKQNGGGLEVDASASVARDSMSSPGGEPVRSTREDPPASGGPLAA